jgi:thymidylate kinase
MITEIRDDRTSINIDTSTDNKQGLKLIRDLCDELTIHKINYCHWKSNANLKRSCTGENDLDLLVSKEDAQNFSDILAHLGFKQAFLRPDRWIPGILDFYGCDWDSGRIVHVHAHYQLILGHDATKNYHIPIERPYLESASQNGLFRIPSTEFELIILVIRLMIKHGTWETQFLRQGKLSPSEKFELEWLMNSASEIKVNELLNLHLPVVSSRLFSDCLHSLLSTSSIGKRVGIGQRLRKCLQPYTRRSPFIDSILILWRRLSWPMEYRLFRIDDRKQLNQGGLLVAIVGGDGSGKTTTIDEIYRWLSPDFTIHRFHMGKPAWSLTTVLIRGLIKIGRSLGFYPFMQSEIVYTNDPEKLAFPGYPWLIREILTGRDRFLIYKKGLQLATNGGLVLLDRFPLSQIKFMDGPQVARMTVNLPQTRLLRYLSELEEDYYKKIGLPDLVILLKVDPIIASRRKTNEIEEEVRSRSGEIWETDWSQSPVIVVDANQSKEQVISEVKQVIWSRM